MKNFCISLLVCIIISVTAICLYQGGKSVTHTEYLRIHVRAQSNSQSDQQVKYLVKDAIVEYLTPYLAECNTKQKAEQMLAEKLTTLESVANGVLKSNGFDYVASVKLKEEKFPTRVYGDLTLESGFYDALIVELGSGKGDNWWCVVYPPLCFVSNGGSYIYKSKIYAIIEEFYKNV